MFSSRTARNRRLGPLLPGALVMALAVLAPRAASAELFELWVQSHGTALMGGGSNFFTEQSPPLLGGGAQIGARLMFVYAHMDVNWLGNGDTSDGESQRIYWNQIGGGLRLGLPIPGDAIKIYGMADANFLNAPFVGADGTAQANAGFNPRIGAGLEIRPASVFSMGALAHGGYAFFGEEHGSGPNLSAQVFLRFRLGLPPG